MKSIEVLLCENTNTALLVILQIRNCWSACRQSPPFHTSPPLSKAFVGCFFVPSFRYRASGNTSSGHVTFALLSERRRSITRHGSLQGAVQAAQLHGLLPRLSGAAGSLRVKQQAALRENIPMAVVNFGIRKLRVCSSNPTLHPAPPPPLPHATIYCNCCLTEMKPSFRDSHTTNQMIQKKLRHI